MLKDKKSPGLCSRLCSPGACFLLACSACLLLGFLTGKLFVEKQISEGGAAALGTGSSVVKVTPKPILTGKQPRKPAPICLNTCEKAGNGICDDGRQKAGQSPLMVRKVYCDLGTDCDDCGPWQPSGPAPWVDDPEAGPVAQLRRKGVEVRVKRTSTTPVFDFAYTDPKKDFDVSHWMENSGGVELGITKIFYKIFKEKCVRGSRRSLFVDVGSNFGWFAVFAATMGCRVLAFEPVPHFHAFLEYSVHLNGLLPLVDMRSNVVSHESGKTMEMVVPARGIWGTAGIGGLNIDRAVESSIERLQIMSYQLDDLVAEDVLLMKVDVEGWEWSVMQGAKKLFKKYNVENIIMEYSPGVPERHFKYDEIIATVGMLQDMHRNGFQIAHIGDVGKHVVGSWDQPLDSFPEVGKKTLQYDMEDALRFKASKLGCPASKEMTEKFSYSTWGICNALPEDVNPRSLRSEIGHNTNIWASKNKKLLPLQGFVGIVDISAPANTWFLTNKQNHGVGSRPCQGMDPKVQVRHRCHCSDPKVCGEEERFLQELLSKKEWPSNYVL